MAVVTQGTPFLELIFKKKFAGNSKVEFEFVLEKVKVILGMLLVRI